jgi:hypothetical protein
MFHGVLDGKAANALEFGDILISKEKYKIIDKVEIYVKEFAKQNNIIKAFYDAIYSSSNYFEYCAKYEKIKYKLNM